MSKLQKNEKHFEKWQQPQPQYNFSQGHKWERLHYTSLQQKRKQPSTACPCITKTWTAHKTLKKWHGWNPKASDYYSGKEMHFGISNFQISQKSFVIKGNIWLRAKLNLTLDTASFLGHSLWKLLGVFPRIVVERGGTATELQATPLFNLIDFGRLNGCHRMENKIHVTSLTEQLADCNLASIGHVHPLLRLLGRMDWQNDKSSTFSVEWWVLSKVCPNRVTMSVADLIFFHIL